MNYISDFELLLLIIATAAVGVIGGLIVGLALYHRIARRADHPPVARVRHDVHHHGLPAADDSGEDWKRN